VTVLESGAGELADLDLIKNEEERRKRTAARFNWHVTYTLLHNPDIRVLRKGYIQVEETNRIGTALNLSPPAVKTQ
jgi:hypothetical protein